MLVYRDEEETPPLQLAASGGGEGALLQAGASATRKSEIGYAALHFAKSEGAVTMLLEAGADKEARVWWNGGETPMHSSAGFGHDTLVHSLVEARANTEARTETRGETPRHKAASHGEVSTVLALHEATAGLAWIFIATDTAAMCASPPRLCLAETKRAVRVNPLGHDSPHLPRGLPGAPH